MNLQQAKDLQKLLQHRVDEINKIVQQHVNDPIEVSYGRRPSETLECTANCDLLILSFKVIPTELED